MQIPLHPTVDDQPVDLTLETRVTLLDVLRDHLGNVSAKKGCNAAIARQGKSVRRLACCANMRWACPAM